MRKFCILFLSCILCFLCIKPYSLIAASKTSVSSSGNSQVVEGNEIVITFLVNSDVVTSGSIEISCSNSLSIVNGEFLLKDTSLASFDTKTNKGAFAFKTAKSLSGNYFQIRLKANSIDKNAWVKATVLLKKDASDLPSGTTTKNINIICKNHTYSNSVETQPTCTSNGNKSRTCSVCGYVDKVSIGALGHDLTNLTVTKEATCTEHGQASGICNRCKQNVTVATDPKGHDWGSWKVITAATCTLQGQETRTCKVCGVSENRITDFAKHQLDENDLTIEREATLYSCGIASGTCKVCSNTVRSEISCSYTDEATHLHISCDEGVFANGTQIIVKINPEDYSLPETLKNSKFNYTIVSIKAILNDIEVQPNGSLTISLPIPEGYSDNVGLIYITNDGHIETVESYKDANNLICKLNHFSNYAVIDYDVKAENNDIFLYSTIGLGITTVIFCLLAISKKKKS